MMREKSAGVFNGQIVNDLSLHDDTFRSSDRPCEVRIRCSEITHDDAESLHLLGGHCERSASLLIDESRKHLLVLAGLSELVSTKPGLKARRMIPSLFSSTANLATTMFNAAFIELYVMKKQMLPFSVVFLSASPVVMTIIFLMLLLRTKGRKALIEKTAPRTLTFRLSIMELVNCSSFPENSLGETKFSSVLVYAPLMIRKSTQPPVNPLVMVAAVTSELLSAMSAWIR
jgi:hypothetical protein